MHRHGICLLHAAPTNKRVSSPILSEVHSSSPPEWHNRGISVSYTHLTLPTIYSV